MEKVLENAYAVILAGGGGTRLWPKSRQKNPKQFLKLFEDQTILQQTFKRIKPLIPKERILIITLKEHVGLIKKQLPNFLEENIIVEPEPKNTALAMGVAAAYVHQRNKEAVIINLAADQMILNEEKFLDTVSAGLQAAADTDNIVAIGIRPTYPHTGLGYIRVGDQFGKGKIGKKDIFIFKGAGFKEKPDLATAQAFLATGKYLWNANLYCWSTKTILEAFSEYEPELGQNIVRVLEAIGTKEEKEVLEREYKKAENMQIDVAVSEKTKKMVVIPGDFGWSDVGDWKVVYELSEKNKDGNVVKGDFIGINTKNSLVSGDERLIVTVGMENIIVVDTGDALLICDTQKTQDVKKAIEQLKEEKKEKYL